MLVLVTGGCGFIGTNLVPRLLDAGHRVRVLDDCSSGDPDRLPADAQLVEADVRDPYAATRATAGADAVVHLAARGDAGESLVDPFTNFDVNARGTLNVLASAQEHGARRLLLASSSTLTDTPASPHAAGKLAAEAYASAFGAAHGCSAATLRLGTVYGPHATRGVVRAFSTAALAGKPLVVYGDGPATRDLVHVDDACDGVLAALGAPGATGRFDLVTGMETTVPALAGLVRRLTGAAVDVDLRPARRGEAARTGASPDRAREAFGFAARVGVEDGVAATVDWLRGRRPVLV